MKLIIISGLENGQSGHHVFETMHFFSFPVEIKLFQIKESLNTRKMNSIRQKNEIKLWKFFWVCFFTF